MPFLVFLAVIGLQIFMVVHVLRNDKPCWWISLIVLLPLIGSLAYFITEILPEHQHAARRRIDPPFGPVTERQVYRRGQVDQPPAGQLRGGRHDREEAMRQQARERQERLHRAPKDPLREGSVHEKLTRAEACLARHKYDEAIDLFAAARQGFFVDAPDILHGLAKAHFGRGDMGDALKLLDELTLGKPSYRPHGVAILKARVLAKQGNVTAALAILDAVLAQNKNLEGRRLEAQYRYAEILWQSGDTQRAATALTEIQRHEKLFRVSDDEREWIRLAGQALQAIS
jgi:hypothetical protein